MVLLTAGLYFGLMLLVGQQEGHPARKKYGESGGGHWLVRMKWRPAGWSACLPLLISPCTIKYRSSVLAPPHPGGPGKRAVKRLWWWCGLTSIFPEFCFFCLGKWLNGNHPASLLVPEEKPLGLVELWTDVFPTIQPSVLKHWREHKALTLTSGLASSVLHSEPGSWWKRRCFLYAGSSTQVPNFISLIAQ